MHHSLVDPSLTYPSLEPGVTLLTGPESRSIAPHQLVISHLLDNPGHLLWIDARDTASTYVFYELAGRHAVLDGIEIARAWTAYQHHSLVKEVVRKATPRTTAIVAPAFLSLYRDPDIPDYMQAPLLESSSKIIRELAHVLDVPVLLVGKAGECAPLESYADHEIQWRRTSHGLAYAGDGFETMLYTGVGWWQTTIPYWVDLFGAVEEFEYQFEPAHPQLELEV